MRSKALTLLTISFLALGAVMAEEGNASTDTIILTTDLNSPDMFAATAAGSYEGIPVITTSNGGLDENVTEILSEASAEEVVIIGGPAVISEEAENELISLGYKVKRLWGLERTRTALEIAKHFWHKAKCAVLVEDTYSAEDDASMQIEASSEAMINGCPLIPVPKGEVPAEVLSTLSDLNVSDVTYVGSEITEEVQDELDGYNLSEVVGNLTSIRNKIVRRILNKTNTMIIVATPNWNESLGFGPALNNNTYVRRVTSINEVQEIIDLINEYNIENVRLVGNPFLAGQVYNELQDNNITAVRYMGHKPSAVARLVWNGLKTMIHERRIIRKAARTAIKTEWRDRVRKLLNDTKSELAELQAEVEELNSEGADTTELEAVSDEADELISQAEGNITEDEDNSLRLLNKAVSALKNKLWTNREVINWAWRERLDDETNTKAKMVQRLNIASEEERLPTFLNSCGATGRDAIKDLIDKAKSLKEESDDEEDPSNAASLVKEAKTAIDYAKKLGNVCINKQSIATKLITKAANQIKRLNVKESLIKTRVARVLRRLI